MRMPGKMRFVSVALVAVIGVIPCMWKCGPAVGGEGEVSMSLHPDEPRPTRLLMEVIGAHTSKILNGIMVGDLDAVVKEANIVADTSRKIFVTFFPESGEIGEWFEETGKDPNNPKDVQAIKDDVQNYLKNVVRAAEDIAKTAKEEGIFETYRSFDKMLSKACFDCHKTFHPRWPNWMKITGG